MAHPAKRLMTIVGGVLLLIAGVAMLVLPGPGLLAIAIALGLLSSEFVWARRLLERVKRRRGGGERSTGARP